MAILIEEPPEGLMDAVGTGLAALPPVAGGGEGAEGTQYRPIPLVSAATHAVAGTGEDRPLPLERVGWRVLVDEGPAMATAEVRRDGEGFALTALSRGLVGDLLADASVAAEEAADDTRDYFARVISLPEIGMEGLWLHADGEYDLVVPLLEEGARPTPFGEFAALARRRAFQGSPAIRGGARD